MNSKLRFVALPVLVICVMMGQMAGIAQVPSAVTREQRLQWWLDARFGMMITWGAYAQAGGVWKGVYEGGYSEWLKFRGIPNVEYDSMVRRFNPVDFDADKWVQIACDAGMKYIVMMAKHHDGFAMYDSKVSDYNIMKMTAFGRDPVAELATACQKAGLKFGVYYSVDRDWHHPDAACDGRYNQCNFWDYPQNKTPGAMSRWHNRYFPDYAFKQVAELVTRYPLDIIWFDGIGLKTPEEVHQLDSLVHSTRPYCLINSRISNFVGSSEGDYASKGDNETPGGYQAGGWENPGTLGFSYGYSVRDSFMSPGQAVHNLVDIASKGGNYLLNVGPDGNGVIIPAAVDILEKMGSWLKVYGASVYGTEGLPYEPPAHIRLTVKPHRLFVHVLEPAASAIEMAGVGPFLETYLDSVADVHLLADARARPLKFRYADGTLTIDFSSCPFPPGKINPYDEVIEVTDLPPEGEANDPYAAWKYSGIFNILTTPEGAGLPSSAAERDFPVLIRLDSLNFDFSQCRPGGEDIRFTDESGVPLVYDLEEWDAQRRSAAIWVRIPLINGNSRQEIHLYWGNERADSESDGSRVFNASNGFVSVVHMSDNLNDETGTVKPVNYGTRLTSGLDGYARHFEEGEGISCGDSIFVLPRGSGPFTTEAWVRAQQANGPVTGWGNEEKAGKIVLYFNGPPGIRTDCYWGDASLAGESRLPLSQWVHLVHTTRPGDSRVYVNGRLDGVSSVVRNPLDIKRPAGMWIGGWRDDYWYAGDIDEVRISNVERSPDWIRMEYENQKPCQSLVGNLVRPGTAFYAKPARIEIGEGDSVKLNAEAGGAIRVYWMIDGDSTPRILDAGHFSYVYHSGRIKGDRKLNLLFRAVYPDTVRTLAIPVWVKERIPEPVVKLVVPKQWNGRDTIGLVPEVTNLATLQKVHAGQLSYRWTVDGGAVVKKILPGKLVLIRSQFSGDLAVRVSVGNGGQESSAGAVIRVTEPSEDPWIVREPGPEDKPSEGQFIARNDQNVGRLFYNGHLDRAADSVFLRVFADGELFDSQVKTVGSDLKYRFTVRLRPGLIHYHIEFGTLMKGKENRLDRVGNIVCGDAYIIQGQSNAEAIDYGRAVNFYASEWLRSYGSSSTDPEKCRFNRWGNAVSFDPGENRYQIGYWGIELGKLLIGECHMPVCILNGAVGGTRIDQHQRNEADPEDSTTIYGRLLWRVRHAGLSDGIRAVFWYQGENDQGAACPDGSFGWQHYRQYFIDMAGGWKQDFPNLRQYYVFQIWPRACAMTEKGSDNRLREVQRTLPEYFSHLSVMSTLGIVPPGGCHYPPEGYAKVARLILPLVQEDFYGMRFERSVTAPNLIRAGYTDARQTRLALEFDQPVVWTDSLLNEFYLDGKNGKVLSGHASGNTLILTLGPMAGKARKISYLDSKNWSQDRLLRGENGIAALTFWEVPIDTDYSTTLIPATDPHVLEGLSPYNWVIRDSSIASSVNGASLFLRSRNTSHVAVQVFADSAVFSSPDRYPILAWTVNGGSSHTFQLKGGENLISLGSNVADPVIDLYIKGMSPFEDRFSGDVPPNAIRITDFILDTGGSLENPELPRKYWLDIGDSILSGDAAALDDGQGRPADDLWAASDEARASYGYLLARHFGYRESRLAFGGYDWGGGLARVPALDVLVDSSTSTTGRLNGDKLVPVPDIVLINLGENGTPADHQVMTALKKIRSRVGEKTKIMVMIPVSGKGRGNLMSSFYRYKLDNSDNQAFLVDLGKTSFATADGQHPTVAGHQAIYRKALPAFEEILQQEKNRTPSPIRMPLRRESGNDQKENTAGEEAYLTLYRPSHPNGTAMVICPGGGYGMLVTGPEGHGIANWLNRNGITGIILEYRLPNGHPDLPLQDAQRAIRLTRSKAKEWKIDPDRIGVIGFSAGGHLASTALTHFDEGNRGAADPVDRFSCRPDFGILIYPVITMGPLTHSGSRNKLLGKDSPADLVNWYSNELQVTDDTPPVFLAHAQDDDVVSPENSRMFFDALREHGVPAKYLMLPEGGHGLNGYSGPMWDAWQTEALKWLGNAFEEINHNRHNRTH